MPVALPPASPRIEAPVRDSKEALAFRLARAERALTVTLETILGLRVELQKSDLRPPTSDL